MPISGPKIPATISLSYQALLALCIRRVSKSGRLCGFHCWERDGRINYNESMDSYVPELAEVCPVLPHPSSDPRRADRLLVEYKVPLFDQRQTPTSNIMYVHETHPFEAYRQLLKAMLRYKESLKILGGCRIVVTPLSSKLVTLGATLACYEMRPHTSAADYGVAIPYAEVTRYTADVTKLRITKPLISCLVLAGSAYDPG